MQDLVAMQMPQLLLENCDYFLSGAGHPQIFHSIPHHKTFSVLPSNPPASPKQAYIA